MLRRLAALEELARQPRAESGISGTWTPTIVGSGTAGSFTYSGTGGDYTRIGDRVFFNARVNITATAVAPTGSLSIAGLPIAATASASVIAGGASFIQWLFNLAAGYTAVGGQILSGTTTIGIVKAGDNLAPAYVDGSEALAAFDLQFWGVYRVA